MAPWPATTIGERMTWTRLNRTDPMDRFNRQASSRAADDASELSTQTAMCVKSSFMTAASPLRRGVPSGGPAFGVRENHDVERQPETTFAASQPANAVRTVSGSAKCVGCPGRIARCVSAWPARERRRAQRGDGRTRTGFGDPPSGGFANTSAPSTPLTGSTWTFPSGRASGCSDPTAQARARR